MAGFTTHSITTLLGYWIHVVFHMVDFTALYENAKKSTNCVASTLSRIFAWVPRRISTVVDNIMYFFCYYILDFHDKHHHNTNINKRWYNVLTEAIQNILWEGGIIVFISYSLSLGLSIYGRTYRLNHTLIMLWSLYYVSYHLINYTFIKSPNTHNKHHINFETNYGPDSLDILFGTKYDIENIEDFNNGTINLVVIFVLIVICKESTFNSGILRYLGKILK